MTGEEVAATRWGHKVRAGAHKFDESGAPDEDGISQHRERIEPWLAALLQAEHLNLLIGERSDNCSCSSHRRARD